MAAQRQVPGGAFVNETATKQRQVPGSQMLGETVTAASGSASQQSRRDRNRRRG